VVPAAAAVEEPAAAGTKVTVPAAELTDSVPSVLPAGLTTTGVPVV
jgi:hypothetical protein